MSMKFQLSQYLIILQSLELEHNREAIKILFKLKQSLSVALNFSQ